MELGRAIPAAAFPGGIERGMKDWTEHVPGDWRNARIEWIREMYNRPNNIDAALAINEGSQPPDYHPGPIWAIFDRAAVERAGWNIDFPYTADNGYFFRADTLGELAGKVLDHPNARVQMPYLEETVARYNEFADRGVDEDFEKPVMHRIDTPPFYAAAITPYWHDTLGALRINGRAQVTDMQGQVIPSLYAGGEASGGGRQHGLGRAIVHGYIAGTNAVEEPALAASPTARQVG